MTQPRKPEDPPTQGAPSDANPDGNTSNGIPDGIEAAEPKGRPTSDRHATETTPNDT